MYIYIETHKPEHSELAVQLRYACRFIYTNTHTDTHKYTYIYIHLYIYLHMYTHDTHICIFMCIYIGTHKLERSMLAVQFEYTYRGIYTDIQIHTYIYL